MLGPERSVAEALEALRTMTVDFALLDMALGGETVFPLWQTLESLGVPFIFVTGNPALLPAEYSARPLVPKPRERTALLSLIPQVLGGRRVGHW